MTRLMPCSLIHRLEEVPLEVLRQRESKWLDMLNNWDKWMAKKHKKVRGLALGLGLAVNRLGGEGRDKLHCSKVGYSPTVRLPKGSVIGQVSSRSWL